MATSRSNEKKGLGERSMPVALAIATPGSELRFLYSTRDVNNRRAENESARHLTFSNDFPEGIFTCCTFCASHLRPGGANDRAGTVLLTVEFAVMGRLFVTIGDCRSCFRDINFANVLNLFAHRFAFL
jgi:hypothetical protein